MNKRNMKKPNKFDQRHRQSSKSFSLTKCLALVVTVVCIGYSYWMLSSLTDTLKAQKALDHELEKSDPPAANKPWLDSSVVEKVKVPLGKKEEEPAQEEEEGEAYDNLYEVEEAKGGDRVAIGVPESRIIDHGPGPWPYEYSQGPKDRDDIHLVFSTDCSGYQNWQSIILMHSAMLIDQPGRVTRLASGCSEEEEAELRAMHAKTFESPRFTIHFTPDFAKDPATGKRYPYYNKPNAILHWLHAGRFQESIVALLDPDMILLKPLLPYHSAEDLLSTSGETIHTTGPQVEEGNPAGQTYGYFSAWMNIERESICGPQSNCATLSKSDGAKYYSVGPPYIAHRNDWEKIARDWVAFVPAVYKQMPSLMAEMYAWSLSASHNFLPHHRLNQYMVSAVDMSMAEGWRWVDELEDVCHYDASKDRLPNILHYCQRYFLGKFRFLKRKFPKDFFTCKHPYLEMPPDDFQTMRKTDHPSKGMINVKEQEARRMAFMVYTGLRHANDALKHFKGKNCDPEDASIIEYKLFQ